MQQWGRKNVRPIRASDPTSNSEPVGSVQTAAIRVVVDAA